MTDKEQCRRLYLDAFGEDECFDRELFELYFKECHFLKKGDKVAAMLFSLPCELQVDERRYPARYIYAAATHINLRANGYMSGLLNEVCADKEIVWLLKPANDALIAFYKKRGFVSVPAFRTDRGRCKVIVDEVFRNLARNDRLDGQKYTAMYRYKEPLFLHDLAFGYVMD